MKGETLGQFENVLFAVHNLEVAIECPNANVAAVEPSGCVIITKTCREHNETRQIKSKRIELRY
jgi:hypothetical protein